MIVERVVLQVRTSDGLYAADVPFSDGLSILRVDNSHGKSTCINSIAYALGMERALGPIGNKLPFPPALTKALKDVHGNEHSVFSSRVLLEIKNRDQEVATIERGVVGSDDENIVYVYGSDINNHADVRARPYFLHSRGDTDSEWGFFNWLSGFVGWDLPMVQKFDGGECLLYPSVFFPAYFVEQKRGWAAPLSNVPTIFGIREPRKRVIEFLLALEPNKIQQKKIIIGKEIDSIMAQWSELNSKVERLAISVGGIPLGISERPSKSFDPYKLDVAVDAASREMSIQFAINGLEKKLLELNGILKDLDEDHAYGAAELAEISKLNDQLNLIKRRIIDISNELEMIVSETRSLESRLVSLEEQKNKYSDLKKIVAKVPELSSDSVDISECPSCGQEISDFLGEVKPESSVMSFDESLSFVKNQVNVVKGIIDENMFRVERKEMSLQLEKKSTQISL